MEWILVTGYTFLILAVLARIRFARLDSIPVRWVQAAFLFKVIAGIGLGMIYSRYYTDRSTADTFKFFDDSTILFSSLRQHPVDFLRMLSGYHCDTPELQERYLARMTAWNNKEMFFNDNRSIIRLNVLFQFFSLGYYYVHVVFLNIFSFVGLICLYKTFTAQLPGFRKQFFILLFLMPSLLFWGSGLLKDNLLLFGAGITLYNFIRLSHKQAPIKFALPGFLFGLTVLLFNKFYILILLLPGIPAYLLSIKSPEKSRLLFSAFYLGFFGLLLLLPAIHPSMDALRILENKRNDFMAIALQGQARHVLQLPDTPLTAGSFILQAPKAIATVLLRPFLWEASSWPVLLAALENIILLVLVFFALLKSVKPTGPKPLVYFSLFFVLSLFLLIGMITPILGAIVRYRIIGIPFLLFLLSASHGTDSVTSRFSFLKSPKP